MSSIMKEDIQFLLTEFHVDADKITSQQWEDLLVWAEGLSAQSAQGMFAIRLGQCVRLCGTPFRLEGQNIREHLKSCHQVYITAATLGKKVDEAIIRWEKEFPVMGKAAHIAANLYLENYCAELQEQVRQEMFEQNLYITNRYWPGYGDFPLENQRGILTLLPETKELGIHLDSRYYLYPEKSVTSVIGISKTPHALSNHVCNVCDLKDTCLYSRFNTKKLEEKGEKSDKKER